ncbi:MAG TPA: metalloregulator ArsR/SmtB family transcription factor [Usitatibacter sp.]|jgi:DNA-binding transcriptional ArsR family regulator|nr:metalloregulator ArsR/SmtB family transcription factor [Usitatibacter sp.]
MQTATAIASLSALAQESRLAIFRLLVEAGPAGLSVGEIGAELKVAPATLSFHLKELSHAGLVTPRQEGRFVFYSAAFERMNALIAYLTDNCCKGGRCETVPRARRCA